MCPLRRNARAQAQAHAQGTTAGDSVPSLVTCPQASYWSPSHTFSGFSLPDGSVVMSAHIPHGSGGFMAPFISLPQLGMPLGNVHPSSTPPVAPQHDVVEICEALSPPAANIDTISWDIRKHPSSATTTIRGRSGGVNMAPHATLGVTDNISISCSVDVVRKLWPDGIQATESPVTIGCVLEAIHRYFQQELTEDQYEEIQEMDPHKYPRMLNDARNERSKLLVQNKENILRVPLKRVDCLGKKHNFGGLKVEYLPDGSYSIVLRLTSKAPSFC